MRYLEAADGLADADGLEPALMLVLGGPIGAYEDAIYPFLKQELLLLERRLAADRPTLGICLGAQLMARALGARVYPGPRKEIGWGPVTLSRRGRRSPLRSARRRGRAGAALARRYLRLAGGRGPPGLDRALRESGLLLAVVPLWRCSFIRRSPPPAWSAGSSGTLAKSRPRPICPSGSSARTRGATRPSSSQWTGVLFRMARRPRLLS